MTDADLLRETHNMVLYVYQEWPRVWSTLVKLESRVVALESRIGSDPPPRRGELGKYVTDSGMYKLPPADLHALLAQHDAANEAATWRFVKNNVARIVVGVVIAALMGSGGYLFGTLMAKAETHSSR